MTDQQIIDEHIPKHLQAALALHGMRTGVDGQGDIMVRHGERWIGWWFFDGSDAEPGSWAWYGATDEVGRWEVRHTIEEGVAWAIERVTNQN